MNKLMYFLWVIISLSLWSCNSNALKSLSDDSGSAAQLEDARMALNDGDYQGAIDILEPGYDQSNPDPEAARILASAYMGKAGFDLTYILENSGNTENRSFDVIASALSLDITDNPVRPSSEQAAVEAAETTARYLSYTSANTFLGYLENARNYLTDLVGVYGNDDDKVQLGMVSAVHFILKVGLEAADLMDTNIPINKTAYREVFPEHGDADWNTLLTSLAANIHDDAALVQSLRDDITAVDNAVTILIARMGSDEEVAERFNEFLTDLLGAGEIDTFDGQEVANYIGAKLLEYQN